jgi:hypothetical protein
MTTLTNSTGSKAVNISNSAPMVFNCFYVQIYKGEETVLQAKTFTTFKGAKNWANKVLN